MQSTEITFPCIRVTQPIGTFYVGSIPARDVLDIAKADIRRIDERDIERIVGIQRELVPRRVKEIKQYVSNIDATFPTSVILAVAMRHATYDERHRLMTLQREGGVATIIDGQHRIAGLEGFANDFDLNVTIFVDMELEDQAMTFATINIKQTKVSRSLVYDLYEFQKARSPQKTCHNIARLLNREPASPFYGRIKILGKATGEPLQFITQASFVTSLLHYVSADPMKDRDLIKRGRTVERASGRKARKLIFRDFFIDDKDAQIARIVSNYFDAVAQRWPVAWDSDEEGNILNRTTGFVALMLFLGTVYRSARDPQGKLSSATVSQILSKIEIRDSELNKDNYLPGSAGRSRLYRDLRTQSGLE